MDMSIGNPRLTNRTARTDSLGKVVPEANGFASEPDVLLSTSTYYLASSVKKV